MSSFRPIKPVTPNTSPQQEGGVLVFEEVKQLSDLISAHIEMYSGDFPVAGYARHRDLLVMSQHAILWSIEQIKQQAKTIGALQESVAGLLDWANKNGLEWIEDDVTDPGSDGTWPMPIDGEEAIEGASDDGGDE